MDNQKARTVILSRLQSGEQLIWSHSPSASCVVWHGPLKWLAFFSWYLAFGALFALAARNSMAEQLFPAVLFLVGGIVFIVVGIVKLISNIRAIWRCWFTVYALTNMRVILVTGHASLDQSIKSDELKTLKIVSDDSRGLLRFKYNSFSGWFASYYHGTSSRLIFAGIPQPSNVKAIIESTLLHKMNAGAFQ